MTAPRYDVLGIGNAIVDVLARAEDDFLVGQGMQKGTMALIDEPRAEAIYDAMGPAIEISGGSGANTIVGVASFGARAAFIGKVKNDTLGHAFTHDIRAAGVAFATPPAADGPSTARCYVLVTPDGERTMNTYLGAAQNLTVADIDETMVRDSAITYLEGYLWDPPAAKNAFKTAAGIAHGAGRQVALTLSDAFCVDRYRDEFLDLIRTGTVDIVFANEAELHSLYQTSDFDTAVTALRQEAKLAVVTPQRERLHRRHPGQHRGGAGFPVEKVVGHHRRRRSVRRRLPHRACARPRSRNLRAPRRARRRRSDSASRCQTRNLAQGAGGGWWAEGVGQSCDPPAANGAAAMYHW